MVRPEPIATSSCAPCHPYSSPARHQGRSAASGARTGAKTLWLQPHNRCASCHTRTLCAIVEFQNLPYPHLRCRPPHLAYPPVFTRCPAGEVGHGQPHPCMSPYFSETFNLSSSRVRPKECHALQPEHSGSGRMQLACTGDSECIDHVGHDGWHVYRTGNQATVKNGRQPTHRTRCTYDNVAPQPRRGHDCCARTSGLRAEIVYGRGIQSIDTDH